MGLRGTVHGRTIELDESPNLPEGSRVEVEIRPAARDPLWGLFADKADMLDEIEKEVLRRRTSEVWRVHEETHPD